MQKFDLLSWLSEGIVGDCWGYLQAHSLTFYRSCPRLACVFSTGEVRALDFSTVFYERQGSFDDDGAKRRPRFYHVSRGRPEAGSIRNRIIKERVKSNDLQPEETPPNQNPVTEHQNVYPIKTRLSDAFVEKSRSLLVWIWTVVRQIGLLLRDQSIWAFQRRRIKRAIGRVAQSAVLRDDNVPVIKRGETVTNDSILLARKFRLISNLLQSVEENEQEVVLLNRRMRGVEYRLDKWWPPYI